MGVTEHYAAGVIWRTRFHLADEGAHLVRDAVVRFCAVRRRAAAEKATLFVLAGRLTTWGKPGDADMANGDTIPSAGPNRKRAATGLIAPFVVFGLLA